MKYFSVFGICYWGDQSLLLTLSEYLVRLRRTGLPKPDTRSITQRPRYPLSKGSSVILSAPMK
jgi:hypothetical protein